MEKIRKRETTCYQRREASGQNLVVGKVDSLDLYPLSFTEFLEAMENASLPLEVKAEDNLKAKSLRVYSEKFNPPLAIRTSMSDFRKEKWMLNLPLYAIPRITDLITR